MICSCRQNIGASGDEYTQAIGRSFWTVYSCPYNHCPVLVEGWSWEGIWYVAGAPYHISIMIKSVESAIVVRLHSGPVLQLIFLWRMDGIAIGPLVSTCTGSWTFRDSNQVYPNPGAVFTI